MDVYGSGTSTAKLAAPDQNKARLFPQYLAAIIVSLGAFAQGTVLAWTSPVGPAILSGGLGFPVSTDQFSWIGSLMALGAIIAVIPTGYCMDILGRKNTMLMLSLPFVIGWILIIRASSVRMVYAGRIVTGMCGGAFSVTGPVYTTEIAQKEIRGSLGFCYQILLVLGVLLTYVAGSYLTRFWLSVACAIVPIVFAVMFFFMPETPVYFLKKNFPERARQSLRRLRGVEYDMEPEMRELEMAIEEERKHRVSMRKAFNTRGAQRGLVVSVGLLVFQQLSGVNPATFYTTVIFKEAGSHLEPTIATIIVGATQFIVTILASFVVDRLGRRILLMASDFIMSLCMFALGTFFYLKFSDRDVTSVSWLPVVSLSVFFFAYAIGYGPIPWLMMGELFLPNIKGAASSISCMSNWFLAFIATKFFSNMVGAFGIHTTFWIFAVLSAIGVVFIYFLVPETKGKPVDQIFREMNGDPELQDVRELKHTSATFVRDPTEGYTVYM